MLTEHSLSQGIILWRKLEECGTHKITLRLSDATKFEGDLLLEYFYNDQRLHMLSFVFAPGRVFQLPDANIAFVGGSQGTPGWQELTRQVARSNGSIHPANMLVLALKAICQSLNISGICGVPSCFQLFNYTNEVPRPENYEFLWSMNGGTLSSHFYYMPSEPEAANDDNLTGTHRTRRRRRRRLRQDMITEMSEEFHAYL